MLNSNSTIGILGGGQLGRMMVQAGKKLGFKFHVFSDVSGAPACLISDSMTISAYDNLDNLKSFANVCDIATYEFENIPLKSAEMVNAITPVVPTVRALKVFQNRISEKEFLKSNKIPCAGFEVVRSLGDFNSAVMKVNLPCVLKTAGMGYDGKGQFKLSSEADLIKLKGAWSENEYVLESFVALKLEFSVVAARSEEGDFKTWGVIENEHRNHILHISVAPGRVDNGIVNQANQIAKKIAEAINYVGVFCVEFFLTNDNLLLVNEIAPRVHNSGHLTIEASACSQFEQHIRAIAGMELGDTSIKTPHAMLNLLGDLWKNTEPDWKSIENKYDCTVHIYGKTEAKAGRKMGHLTFSAESPDAAYTKAQEIFNVLSK